VVGDSALQHIDPEMAVDTGAWMDSTARCQEEADASQSIADDCVKQWSGACVCALLARVAAHAYEGRLV